eukprot:3721348-Amphidinium_carterae.1
MNNTVGDAAVQAVFNPKHLPQRVPHKRSNRPNYDNFEFCHNDCRVICSTPLRRSTRALRTYSGPSSDYNVL